MAFAQQLLRAEMGPQTTIFFGKKNREYLHNSIIRAVKVQTGHEIGKQQEDNLQFLMTRVFSEFPGTLQYMNNKVMEYAVPNVIHNINDYIFMLNYDPMKKEMPPLGIHTSRAGNRKELEVKIR